MRIVGIDPGLDGAIAFYDTLTGRRIVHDMPTIPMGKEGNKRQLSGALLRDVLENLAPIHHAYLELVTGMPRGGSKSGAPAMGATSAFNFGGTYHGMRIALEYGRAPYTLVTPASWKRRLGLIGADKEASRLRALQLFPDMTDGLKRKKDVGRAEALLIAHYGALLAQQEAKPDPFEESQR